jgi:hypothetical protein
MTAPLLRLCFACLLTASAAVSAQTPAPAPSPASGADGSKVVGARADAAKAGDQCETAVAELVRRMRGRDAQEVQFVGTKRALSPGTDDETGVRGEGRYRGSGRSMPFTYSCTFNTGTGLTSGVVFRDTGAAAAAAAATEKPWQPDLTNLSPEACESAAAASLKDRHPRVSRVTFGSDSRQMRPGPNDHLLLEGRGAVERAPGMNAIPFTYRCEVETRRGRVVAVQTFD